MNVINGASCVCAREFVRALACVCVYLQACAVAQRRSWTTTPCWSWRGFNIHKLFIVYMAGVCSCVCVMCGVCLCGVCGVGVCKTKCACCEFNILSLTVLIAYYIHDV